MCINHMGSHTSSFKLNLKLLILNLIMSPNSIQLKILDLGQFGSSWYLLYSIHSCWGHTFKHFDQQALENYLLQNSYWCLETDGVQNFETSNSFNCFFLVGFFLGQSIIEWITWFGSVSLVIFLQVLLITRFLQHEHHLGRSINQVFFLFQHYVNYVIDVNDTSISIIFVYLS